MVSTPDLKLTHPGYQCVLGHVTPRVHYVPVALDLSDLPARYLWAQNNQAQAREIAAAGAVYARDMSAERMWATYASLPLEEAREAYHAVGGAGVAVTGSDATDSTAGVTDSTGGVTDSTGGVTDVYQQLVRQLVPIYAYDTTKDTGGDKSHAGVLLPDGEQVRNMQSGA
jgi:hypothetical protein